jgi:uncharacterized protein (DUF433 family)
MAMKHYISSDPTILSGMPVITGTRVPIARILSLLKELPVTHIYSFRREPVA